MSLLEGDLDGSTREMTRASELAKLNPPAMIRENIISLQVWVELRRGRLPEAARLLAGEGFTFGATFRYPKLAPGLGITYNAGLLYNSALRVLLHRALAKDDRSELEGGIELAQQLSAGALRCQHLPIALETLLLSSQMHAALGNIPQSLAEAARALELAKPEGYISLFLEEGQAVAELLRSLLKSGLPGNVSAGYVREILAAFPPELQPAETAQRPAPKVDDLALVEPLTARELEVLRLIAAGDSNHAIAEKLVITVSSVKKHAGNIYGKLSVSSRTQAIAQARLLGLLSPGN
jgi:LuxR family maltose regulon positive regulatory protein